MGYYIISDSNQDVVDFSEFKLHPRVTIEFKYSRVDQVKFVEDSL